VLLRNYYSLTSRSDSISQSFRISASLCLPIVRERREIDLGCANLRELGYPSTNLGLIVLGYFTRMSSVQFAEQINDHRIFRGPVDDDVRTTDTVDILDDGLQRAGETLGGQLLSDKLLQIAVLFYACKRRSVALHDPRSPSSPDTRCKRWCAGHSLISLGAPRATPRPWYIGNRPACGRHQHMTCPSLIWIRCPPIY